MMHYRAADIASIISPNAILARPDDIIELLLTDSRQLLQPDTTLFFGLRGDGRSGEDFISELYHQGVRNFVIATDAQIEVPEGANIFRVANVIQALQRLAAEHRKQFQYPVIGITGSNGKTIVKEWLYQLLHKEFNIVRSPKSYNSQIGVPLSVWQMEKDHTLGIFEAGISTRGEMMHLQQVIQPTIGVLTNIGEAHDAGFISREEKLQEKALLFRETECIIAPYEMRTHFENKKLLSWGREPGATVRLLATEQKGRQTGLTLLYQDKSYNIVIPFVDEASIHNAITCFCILLQLNVATEEVLTRFHTIHAVDMRLQLMHAINNCLVVNDSYSADLTSLKIALNFLHQQSSGLKRTVILSDFAEAGRELHDLYKDVAQLLGRHEVSKIIAIGHDIGKQLSLQDISFAELITYTSTEEFLQSFRSASFLKEIILIKGARRAAFERVVALFETRLHQTVLNINLEALSHNLKQYRRRMNAGTRIMAMVKAFAYGSGALEIAGVLQAQQANYLAVAYADEGVELVKAGIRLPVMVMNTEPHSFQSIVDHNLQPVLFSFSLLHQFEKYLEEQALQHYPVHVELETGMNRLGFVAADVELLAKHIADSKTLHVQSVFTHLAASEEAAQDAYTLQQSDLFKQAVSIIEHCLPYHFLKHIANSAAIVRHPQLQMDMVRLGIGLYGIEVDDTNVLELQQVATLRSTIAQLKSVPANSSVSYNRKGIVKRDTLVATVRIGYADGYSRRFGHGKGKMLVRGRLAPVIGTVCMDMTMIDVTDIPLVQEGDEVIIFGAALPIQEIAGWIDAIPYEIMTGISQRVKRIYYHE